MWDDAARSLVERDAGIRGLAAVLSADHLSAAVREGGGVEWSTVRIIPGAPNYVRYKPGQNCIAVHRVQARSREVEVYAKAFGPDVATKVAKAREFASVPGPIGAGRLVLPELGVVLSTFPNDGKLTRLRRLGNAADRRRLLARIFYESVDLEHALVTRLAYKPERRYVARVDVAGVPFAVVKFYSRRGFERARRAALAVSSRSALRGHRPIGRSQRYAALAFAWQEGRPLRAVERVRGASPVAESRWDGSADRRVGEWLYELHEAPTLGLPTVDREHEISRLRELCRNLQILVPASSSKACELASELTSWLAQEPLAATSVHGDFYDKQILLSCERPTVIDWDEAALGDARSDCGQYIAHIEWDVIRGDLDVAAGRRRIESFLEGYGSTGGLRRGVNKYVAIGLFRLAHHPFRMGARRWDRMIVELLERARAWSNTDGEVACESSR